MSLGLVDVLDGDGSLFDAVLAWFLDSSHTTTQAPKDAVHTPSLANARTTCRAMRAAVDRMVGKLLLPRGGQALHGIDDFSDSLSPWCDFVHTPARRRRAFTATDSAGRHFLDKFAFPIFAVRHRGLRWGDQVYTCPALAVAEADANHQPPPHQLRLASAVNGVWELQPQVFFKMRTYTRFERLKAVYADRARVPLPWLHFQVADRLYAAQEHMGVDELSAEESLPRAEVQNDPPASPMSQALAAETAAESGSDDEREEAGVEVAQMLPPPGPAAALPKARPQVLLERGQSIQAAHSLWMLGLESGAQRQAKLPAVRQTEHDVWVETFLDCPSDHNFVVVRDRRSSRKHRQRMRAQVRDEPSEVGGKGGVTKSPPVPPPTEFGSFSFPLSEVDELRDEEPEHTDGGDGTGAAFHGAWLFRVPSSQTLGQLLPHVTKLTESEHGDHELLHFVAVSPYDASSSTSSGNHSVDQPMAPRLRRSGHDKIAAVRVSDTPINAARRAARSRHLRPLPLYVIDMYDIRSFLSNVWRPAHSIAASQQATAGR